jgi:hypothetical protein
LSSRPKFTPNQLVIPTEVHPESTCHHDRGVHSERSSSQTADQRRLATDHRPLSNPLPRHPRKLLKTKEGLRKILNT